MPDAGTRPVENGMDVRSRASGPPMTYADVKGLWEALKGALMCLPGSSSEMVTVEINESMDGLTISLDGGRRP